MAKSKYTFGVFIGRFQPFHNGHIAVVKESLEFVNHLIILLGGAKAARTSKNPWTEQEREDMIVQTLTAEGIERKKYTILGIQDYYYNEQKWLSEVQAKVMQVTRGNQDIVLLGHDKDRSSYYLKSFPEWDFKPTKTDVKLDATSIRNDYFRDVPTSLWQTYAGKGDWRNEVSPPTVAFLERFQSSPDFERIRKELSYLKKYKEEQALYPYPIIFVTVDNIVMKSGHILLVKRGDEPGKGLWALPGGFLNPQEEILAGSMRELYEETKLSLLPHLLEASYVETRVFAAPERSLRGRTITHASMFDLGGGQLNPVEGADDADEAMWVSTSEIMASPEKFFEDHYHIIYSFLMRY